MVKHKQKGPVEYKVLSDRGNWLEERNLRSQGTNPNRGQKVAISEGVSVEIGQICPSCKKRVRGPNHVNGAHHKGNVPACGGKH